MIKYAFYHLMVKHHMNTGLRQLRNFESRLVSKNARFAIPFVYRGKGYFKRIDPRQNPTEIEALYSIVCQRAPVSVLEIGTARGGTLYLWCQASTDKATIVSVDLPEGDFGGAYPECRIPFYRSFERPGQKLHLIRNDSHSPRVVEEVKETFGNTPIDFAFIDGDHTYEGVKADFFNYGPMVRKGGIIAFHDILPHPDMKDIEVDRFWKEIRKRYRTKEIIGPDTYKRRIGIGIVFVDKRILKE